MTMHVRDAGSWKAVRNDGLYVRDAGSWKQVEFGYVRDAGSWKQFHVLSDPLTLTFAPSWTASYTETSPFSKPDFTFPDIADVVIQGDWEGIGDSSGQRDWNGCIMFDCAGIRSAFGGRTVVSSARLRLTNRTSAEPSGTPVELHQGTNLPTSEPSTLDVIRSGTVNGPTIDEGVTDWVESNATMVDWAQDVLNGANRGLVLYDTESDPIFRGYFWGTEGTSSTEPRWEITADYI